MYSVLKTCISCWKFSPLIFQDMAAQRCVNTQCNKYAKRESVYCGTDCIHQHAKDSLRVLNRYDAKRGKAVSTDRPTVCREIFDPILFLSLLPLVSAGEFKSGWIPKYQISLFKHNPVVANSRQVETIFKFRKEKIRRGWK